MGKIGNFGIIFFQCFLNETSPRGTAVVFLKRFCKIALVSLKSLTTFSYYTVSYENILRVHCTCTAKAAYDILSSIKSQSAHVSYYAIATIHEYAT